MATDQAGNVANCSYNILLVDKTPPDIICPLTAVIQYFNTTDIEGIAYFPPVNVTSSDVVSIEYEPPNGSTVFMRYPLTVLVIAYDSVGNRATCEFNYIAQRKYAGYTFEH